MQDERNTQEPSGRYGGRNPEDDEVESHAHGSWKNEEPGRRAEDPSGRTAANPEDEEVESHSRGIRNAEEPGRQAAGTDDEVEAHRHFGSSPAPESRGI